MDGSLTSEVDNWVIIGLADEFSQPGVYAARVGDRELAVYNVNGGLFVTENICTHAFAYLSEGYLEGYEIECPLHAGKFDVRSGKGLCAPITSDLKTYPVRVQNGSLQALIT